MYKTKRFRRIKSAFITIIIAVCIVYGAVFIKKNHYVFLYITPYNNTRIYPYISQVSKDINQILFSAAKNLRVNYPDAKILYTNGYGSGFLKNNYAPSDYDYAAGLYLGKYEYNGQNASEIARNILNTVSIYQANIYSLVNQTNGKFYTQRMSSERILGINNKLDSDTILLASSLETALKGKPYSLKVVNEVFLLQPNEIVLPSYDIIRLYSKNISYYPGYKKILRELTTTIEYYVDIIDKQTDKTYPMTLVASVGDGKRLYQPKLRYFVPNTYTSMASLNHVKKTLQKLDDNTYINLRLTNYFHHFILLSYGNSKFNGNPLKIVKRLLQCTDILSPVLPKNVLDQIHNSTYNILQSPTIALINDYYNANEILYSITKSEKFYMKLEQNKEVSNLIADMENILYEMINDSQLIYNELKPLFDYQKELGRAKTNLAAIKSIIEEKYPETKTYIEELMFKKMPNNKKLSIYMDYLNKVVESAGIYNIRFYKDRSDHIYVFKDDFTRKLNLDNLSELDISNGTYTHIYDNTTKFEFMDPQNLYGSTKKVSCGWVRYNTTQLQDSIYEDLKKYLLKDKKNFRIRIRPGIQR